MAISTSILLVLIIVCFSVPQARAEIASADQYGAVSGAASVSSGNETGTTGNVSDTAGNVSDTTGAQSSVTGSGGVNAQPPGGALDPGTPKTAANNSGSTVSNQPTTGLVNETPPADPPSATNCVAGTLDEKCYELHLYCSWGEPGTYWASKADYLAGLLSIDYKLENKGTGDAINVVVSSATATNGVTVWTKPLPDLGTLLSGESIVFTLKWLVPPGVGSFVTNINVCADCNGNHELDGGGDGAHQTTGGAQSNIIQPAVQPLAATVLPSALPNTGFSLTHAFLILMGIAALAALMTAPAGRLIRIRRR